MQNILCLAVQTQQIKQIKYGQHNKTAAQYMPDGQPPD